MVSTDESHQNGAQEEQQFQEPPMSFLAAPVLDKNESALTLMEQKGFSSDEDSHADNQENSQIPIQPENLNMQQTGNNGSKKHSRSGSHVYSLSESVDIKASFPMDDKVDSTHEKPSLLEFGQQQTTLKNIDEELPVDDKNKSSIGGKNSYFGKKDGDDSPSEPAPLATPMMNLKTPPKNFWRLLCGITYTFALGLSDAAPGALLGHIEEYYNIGYATVSLIWLGNSLGFICIALFSHKLNLILGKHMVLTCGCGMLVLMYALLCWAPPFPLAVISFFFGGLGMASVLTQHNIFLSHLDKADEYLGYFHGSYGAGATLAPIIATAMVNNGVQWSYYYTICLAFSCINVCFSYVSFNNYSVECEPWIGKEERYVPKSKRRALEAEAREAKLEKQRERALDLEMQQKLRLNNGEDLDDNNDNLLRVENVEPKDTSENHSLLNMIENNSIAAEGGSKSDVHMAMTSKYTWLLAFFTMFYQGGEVAVGGWIDTFLIRYRHADARSYGYVASGYWGGLCLGRFLLTRPLSKMGPRKGVALVCVIILVLDVLAWTIKDTVAVAVIVSFIGVAMGPIYPLLVTVTVQILPRRIQLVSMTMITAFGSTGGALFPFLVGIASQFKSTYTMHPFVIALTAAMLFMWLLLPDVDKDIIQKYKRPKKPKPSQDNMDDVSDRSLVDIPAVQVNSA